MIPSAIRVTAVLVAAAMFVSPAQAKFRGPQPAPIDRLITNTEAFIKENPRDASGYFTLARIHYLAFSLKTAEVGVMGDAAGLPTLASDQMQNSAPAAKAPAEQQMTAHARAAVQGYQKAIELDPKNALYHLGYASLLDSAPSSAPAASALVPLIAKADTAPDQPDLYKGLRSNDPRERTEATDKLRALLPGFAPHLIQQLAVETDPEAKNRLVNLIADVSRIKALEEYTIAFDLAAPNDLKIQNRPTSGLQSLVSYEAANRYTELARELPANSKPEVLAKMAEAKKALDGKRMGPVTPIVFSLEAGKNLDDLVSPTVTTTFDLDGTGRGFTWPWVQPETAILAWDPQHTGQITSGWQLFGSVTFNMFWTDGYRALDALDDNRDGILSGDELRGLVLWYDRNGNGKADPGELLPIEVTPIKSIRVHPDTPTSGDEQAVPTAANGIILRDGQSRTTWDWMTRPK